MTINLIPYGQLPDGNYGINLDNLTGDPIASVMEVKDTLPAAGDPLNFVGRLVFAKDVQKAFIFNDTPSPFWDPLEGIPAEVDAVAGNPPTVPTPPLGGLFWDTDTEVLFVWDGIEWQAAGGRYATVVVERKYNGDNITTTYSTGTSSAPLASHVEAFLNGVRQINNVVDPGSPDYSIVGTNIIFVTPPALGVEIFVRSLETIQVAQTAEAFDVVFTSYAADQLEFDTGRTDIQPEAMIVTINGATQVLGTDYTISQADTTIVSITKAFPADIEAIVTTTAPHGIVLPGTVVEIRGYTEPEGDGVKYSVLAVDSPTVFRIVVTATDFAAPPTPDPIGFFTPSFITNKITFTVAPYATGDPLPIPVIYVKMFKALVTGPATGEINTLAKLPSAVGQDITAAKAAEVLQVKGILAGTNVSVVDNGTDLVISSATGSTSEARVGATGNFLQPSPTESYVGVSSTPSTPVTIDMAVAFNPAYAGPGDPNARGRRILIKDEGGAAGVNNITITGPVGALYEGAPNYTISTNFGAVELVFDDTNWWITQVYP